MSQVIRKVRSVLVAIAFIFPLGLQLCCSGTPIQDKPSPFDKAAQESTVDRRWKESFPGPITDIALGETSGTVLAASIPDPDSGGKYLLTLLNKKGKILFRNESPAPVKGLDIANDGSWMVVNNHSGKLVAYDQTGKELWNVDGACRPIIINRSREIFCYHDDDTKPSFAFDIYNEKGERTSRYPIRLDVLTVKVSADEQWIVLGLTGGKTILLDSKFKLVREFRVKGELLDITVSSGTDPRIAVLSMVVTQGQLISVFDVNGKLRGTAKPSVHVEQVEILASGQLILVYGNSPKGQYIAQYSGHDVALTWQKQDSRYADYSLSIQLGVDKILMGFEDTQTKTRRSKIIVLDLDGRQKADIPLETAEGAYLYSFSYSPESSLLAVGTDDKTLQLYELK